MLGNVNRFNADEYGGVLLETQWGIETTNSQEWPVKSRRTRYTAQTESPGDPVAIASAMNEALAKFSRDVANEMRVVLQQ